MKYGFHIGGIILESETIEVTLEYDEEEKKKIFKHFEEIIKVIDETGMPIRKNCGRITNEKMWYM